MSAKIIVIANQKGGVGKTTTTVNLAHGLSLLDHKVLAIDGDPQGNLTQAFGIPLESIRSTIGDLIRDSSFPINRALYKGDTLDVIPATPALARIEREMIGKTNSEMRLAQRLREIRNNYSYILIDTPPTFGPMMNSALNAADKVVVPVDSGYFALVGIKELLEEVDAIKLTNPQIGILGYLMTFTDLTNVAAQTWSTLVSDFGNQVFETKIRRSVKLKEAPSLGKTIFSHAPDSNGALDYYSLANEVADKLRACIPPTNLHLISGNPL